MTSKTPKEWREGSGLSQEQVAALLGVSDGYVSLLETGERNPSWDLIQKYKEVSGGAVTAEGFEKRVAG